jgi:hypothetical protein
MLKLFHDAPDFKAVVGTITLTKLAVCSYKFFVHSQGAWG